MSQTNPEPRSMTLDEFTPHVGKLFTLHASPDEVEIELVEAYPLRENAFAPRPPFQLIFRSGPDVLLMAGSFVMRTKGFGPDVIYISQTNPPPGDQRGGHYYQAVFN